MPSTTKLALKNNNEALAVSALGLVAPAPIHVECAAFTGSLATLFGFVREKLIDLNDIPLAPICLAYFEYVRASIDIDLDQSAAALASLAYLLERKAWGLLPNADPEPEEELEILDALPDGHSTIGEYFAAIDGLISLHAERQGLFFRPGDAVMLPENLPFTIQGVRAVDLAAAFQRVLDKAKPTSVQLTLSPKRSLSDVMRDLIGKLDGEIRPLEWFLPSEFDRLDVVYVFLGLLELVRLAQADLCFEALEVGFRRPPARMKN